MKKHFELLSAHQLKISQNGYLSRPVCFKFYAISILSNLNFKLSIHSDYINVIENDDVEGLTIQTIEINLTNGKVDY